ncbi:hypothetical protein HD597_010045 [Nonomuraea thailandensis]|uniref:Uncharacterized protein n=1 Tax=Nonomuraea thailandensis TaxID=1188745 RepID=A0A9X2K7W2_9ACTN|nr:hypothetical protein [Nonomuraea thailandensis]MCP2363025.1 hypothetical protein [Nonomuraea thailandensis]
MDGSTLEVARPRVRLRRAVWDSKVEQHGLTTDTACAALLQTSVSTIHRIKENKVEPSGKFIASALFRLPGTTFEDLFEVVVPWAD